MKQILAEREHRLTKSLGQNFLHDGNQLRRIVASAELGPDDRVLEIGPGLGPLTERLLPQAAAVLAIEKDRRLVEVLRERFPEARAGEEGEAGPTGITGAPSKLTLVHGDALKILRGESRDWSGWKLVSNLPYSVASPILVELAQANGSPARMVVTVQREVARRLMAQPGDPEYGVLTLLLQLRYKPFRSFKIPASCFFPPPDVESACVDLIRHPERGLTREEEQRFIQIVKRAFSQRRKMLIKLLKQDWPEDRLVHAFKPIGIDGQARAESVRLEQFVELARRLADSEAGH